MLQVAITGQPGPTVTGSNNNNKENNFIFTLLTFLNGSNRNGRGISFRRYWGDILLVINALLSRK